MWSYGCQLIVVDIPVVVCEWERGGEGRRGRGGGGGREVGEGGAHRYASEERLVMAMGSMLVMKLKLRELWKEGGREGGREKEA